MPEIRFYVGTYGVCSGQRQKLDPFEVYLLMVSMPSERDAVKIR